MKLTWRFLLGATIGAGLGYAVVLLTHPGAKPQTQRWQTLYQAAPDKTEEHTAT